MKKFVTKTDYEIGPRGVNIRPRERQQKRRATTTSN